MRHPLHVVGSPSLVERAETAMRVNVCSHCPYRSKTPKGTPPEAPRECETACKIFQHLPRLVKAARCVDPMVGDYPRIMDARLRDFCERHLKSDKGRQAFVLANRRQIIEDVGRIVGR